MAERLLLCLFSDLEMDGAVFFSLLFFLTLLKTHFCNKFLVSMWISRMTRWLRYEESGASFF